jgi:protein phosphatase
MTPTHDRSNPVTALRDAVAAANRTIRELIDADESTEAMGTTVTALLLVGDQVGLLHVGDSRAYLLHGGKFEQITRDDTYVQTLIDEGLISDIEARTHPRRSVVMQAVQGLAYDPTTSVRTAAPGDRYLLCSDGLTDVVGDEAIHNALEMEPDPARCAQILVRAALQAGAPDNVTVIVADVVRE